MRVLGILALAVAGPAAAECFTGQPHRVTFSDGNVMTVLERKGDDVTFAWGDEPDTVRKAHLMMFHLETRKEGKVDRKKWIGRLPKSADLVPGFQFTLKGSFTGSDGTIHDDKLQGTVLAAQSVTLGACAYQTTVVKQDYYMNGEWLYFTTDYLRTDMMIVLRSDIQPSGAKAISRVVTALD